MHILFSKPFRLKFKVRTIYEQCFAERKMKSLRDLRVLRGEDKTIIDHEEHEVHEGLWEAFTERDVIAWTVFETFLPEIQSADYFALISKIMELAALSCSRG